MKKQKIFTICFIAVLVMSELSFLFGIKTVSASEEQYVYPLADSRLDQASPDTNYGTVNSYAMYTWDSNRNRRGIYKFNLSEIPSGSTITSVVFYIYQYSSGNLVAGVTDAKLMRVATDSWTEDGVTWNNQPAYGAQEGSAITGANGWNTVTITTYANQEWGGDKIMSFILKNTVESYDSTSRYRAFYTKEAANPDYYPYILVTYTPADVEPPTYSDVDYSTDFAGTACDFSSYWNDDTELYQWIFSWNGSGSWANDTDSFVSTPSWANISKTLPTTPNQIVGFMWYAVDTYDNWNATDIYTLVISALVPSQESHVTTEKLENDVLSVYWEAVNTDLDSYVFSIDSGGGYGNETWQNFGSTNQSWSNHTLELNFVIGTELNWLVYANDSRGYEAVISEQSFTVDCTIWFYYNTGGSIWKNGTYIANTTSVKYSSEQTLELLAVPNSGYAWQSFNWTGGSSTTNPDNYTVTTGIDIWCYFSLGGGGTPYVAAAFTFNPSNPQPHENIFFNATLSSSSSPITEYFWDFGDETNDTGVTLYHNYTTAGSYLVSLNVTSADGSATMTQNITVGGFVTARYTYTPPNPHPQTTITFDATTSNSSSSMTYYWDFGDTHDDTGAIVTHAYTTRGNYTVILTVATQIGNDTFQQIICVDYYVFARFTFSPSNPEPSTSVDFNAMYSNSSVPITGYYWEFGDLDSDTGILTSHSYTSIGTYTAELTVTTSIGNDTYAQEITVERHVIPFTCASFTFSPTNPDANTTVTFNATTSTSSGTITNYQWVFGDGNTTSGGSYSIITHQYLTNGTYTVNLTVTSTDGENAVDKDITIGTTSTTTTKTVPGGIIITKSTITLDVLIQTSFFQSVLWDNVPIVEVYVVNKGIPPADVIFNYDVRNEKNLIVASGHQTAYIPKDESKTLQLRLVPLPPGHYSVHVQAVDPKLDENLAFGNGDLIVSAPYYGQLWFITLVGLFIASIIAILVLRHKRKS